MSPIWKHLHIFRSLPVEPEYLIITAWGREFRVQPSKPLRNAGRTKPAKVTIEVVGPSLRPDLDVPPPMRVVHVEVLDERPSSSDHRPPPPPYQSLELVYDEDDDVTAVSAPPAPAAAMKGAHRGT